MFENWGYFKYQYWWVEKIAREFNSIINKNIVAKRVRRFGFVKREAGAGGGL